MNDDLKFFWKAEFADDSVLVQFPELGVETLFSEVEAKMEDLVRFSVVSVDDDQEVYYADLKSGVVGGNGVVDTVVTGDNLKLVYSRRNEVRAEVGTNKIIDSRRTHRVGLSSDSDEKVLEVFEGVGVLNKRVGIVDSASKKKIDYTDKVVRNRPLYFEEKRSIVGESKSDALIVKSLDEEKVVRE
jgi:hypothetical protein